MIRRATPLAAAVCAAVMLAGCAGGAETGTSSSPQNSHQPTDCRAEYLGNIMMGSYPDDSAQMVFARNVWDMQTYRGKVYFGGGDYDANMGPCDIYCYDSQTGKIDKSASALPDEQIARFVTADHTVFLPITDNIGSGKGGYFKLENGVWQCCRYIDGALHCFDMVKYAGRYFAGIGLDYGDNLNSAIKASVDGIHFDNVDIYRDGRKARVDSDSFGRCYDLFTYGSGLYAYYRADTGDYFNGLYRYDGESNRFEFISTMFLPLNCRNSYENYLTVQSKFEFGGKMFFINNCVICTDDFAAYTTLALPHGAVARDGWVRFGKMYITAAVQKGDGRYDNYVFAVDSSGGVEEIICFTAAGYCVSFEYCEDCFLFAIGTSRTQLKTECGSIYKIAYKL